MRCAAPRDKASKDKRPRCSRAVVLRGSPVGAIAPSASHLRMTGIERQSWQMAHPAFRRPSGHTFTSRGISCPSFAAVIALEDAEGAGKAGCRLAPAVRCAQMRWKQMHSGIQVKPNIRPSLRSGFTAYVVLSPGSDALLPPSSCGWLICAPGRAAHITARLGAQTPGARTTRFCRTRAAPVVCAWGVAHGVTRPANRLRADAARVHHIPSRVS